jgi:hypothetical protein
LDSSKKKKLKIKKKIKSLSHEGNDEPINLIYNGPNFLNNEYKIIDSPNLKLKEQNEIDDTNFN